MMWKETSLNLGQATIPCLLKQEDIANQYFPEKNVPANFVKNDEIEDEVHLLFKCSLNADLREILFQKIASLRVHDFNPDDQSNALNLLFASTNIILKSRIANYIHKCLSKRKDIIKMEIRSMLYNEYLR